jgi:hypothetical protein
MSLALTTSPPRRAATIRTAKTLVVVVFAEALEATFADDADLY